MLVLSRKQGEAIELPELGVQVHVLRIAGNRTQIGIDAPSTIRIQRGELCEPSLCKLSQDEQPLQQPRRGSGLEQREQDPSEGDDVTIAPASS